MIEFKDGRYVSAVWYLSNNQGRDWLAILYRDAGLQSYTIQYRFKYDGIGSTRVEGHKVCEPGPETKLETIVDLLAANLQDMGFLGDNGLYCKVTIQSASEEEVYEKLNRALKMYSRGATLRELSKFKPLEAN